MPIEIQVRNTQFGDAQLQKKHFSSTHEYASFLIESATLVDAQNQPEVAPVVNATDLSALNTALSSDITDIENNLSLLLTSLGVAFGLGNLSDDFVWDEPSFVSTLGGTSNGDLSTTLLNIDGVLNNIEGDVATNLALIQANGSLISNLQAALTQEIQDRTDGDNALSAALANEVNLRQQADATLTASIGDLRGDVNATLGFSVADPTQIDGSVDFSNANHINVASVNSIKTALETLDGAIGSSDSRIDAILTSLGFDDGSGNLGTQYNPTSTTFIQGNTVVEDISLIDDKVTQHHAQLTAAIGAEATQRQIADQNLQNNIDAEALARANADANLQSNIDAETAARIAEDTQLGSQIASTQTELNATQTSLGFGGVDGSTYTSGGTTHATNNNVTQDIADLDAGIVANAASITALGSAFQYVGTIDVSSASTDDQTPTTLASIISNDPNITTETGDYYRLVSSATEPVYIQDGSGEVYAVVDGDALVFNSQGGVDRFDNSDPTVNGGSNITVTKTGKDVYEVAVSTIFEGRVSTNESDISALQTGLANEINNRQQEDALLQQAINAEAAARATEDTAINNRIDTEILDRTNADNALQTALDAEIARAIAAEQALQSDIDQNESDSDQADAALQANIDAETAARISGDASLQANIDAEAATRAAADTVHTDRISNINASAGFDADGRIGAFDSGNSSVQSDTYFITQSNSTLKDAIEELDAALQVAQTVTPSRLTFAPITHQYASYDRCHPQSGDLSEYASRLHLAQKPIQNGNVSYNGHNLNNGTSDIGTFEVADMRVTLGAMIHTGAPNPSHNNAGSHVQNRGYWYNVAVFKNGIRLFQRQSSAANLGSADEYQVRAVKFGDANGNYHVQWPTSLRYPLFIPTHIETTFRFETLKATTNQATGQPYTYGDVDPNGGEPHPLAGMKNIDDAGNNVHVSLAGTPHPQGNQGGTVEAEVRYWIVEFGAALNPQDIITVDYMGLLP